MRKADGIKCDELKHLQNAIEKIKEKMKLIILIVEMMWNCNFPLCFAADLTQISVANNKLFILISLFYDDDDVGWDDEDDDDEG